MPSVSANRLFWQSAVLAFAVIGAIRLLVK